MQHQPPTRPRSRGTTSQDLTAQTLATLTVAPALVRPAPARFDVQVAPHHRSFYHHHTSFFSHQMSPLRSLKNLASAKAARTSSAIFPPAANSVLRTATTLAARTLRVPSRVRVCSSRPTHILREEMRTDSLKLPRDYGSFVSLDRVFFPSNLADTNQVRRRLHRDPHSR